MKSPPSRYMLPFLAAFLCTSAALMANDPPAERPDAAGHDSHANLHKRAVAMEHADFTPDDVAFMQGMIVHHRQAVDMSVLAMDRTGRPEVITFAQSIQASQTDEIAFMTQWLADRGQPAQTHALVAMDHAAMDHAAMDHSAVSAPMMDHSGMAGMASPEQMDRLETLRGAAFDRAFLTMMITHHEGALTMVEDLLEHPGAAADPVLEKFTTAIVNDQSAEIDGMSAVLAAVSQ